MPNEYWDFSKSGKENAEAYLAMCAENNKRPKFYKLLQNNGDGSYSLKADGSTDGYWKLLIDFKMYDNDGIGSPQMPVKPDFNMEESMRMLNDYRGGHSNFPVAQGIVDDFVKEYKDSHKSEKFSDQSEFMDSQSKYSLRGVSIPSREELNAKDPVKVVDISEPLTKGTYAERRREIKQKKNKVISKPYLNKDTNTLIFLTEKSYEHAFSNKGEIQINAAEHFPEFIETAILTHAEPPEADHGSDYAEMVYTFFAAARAENVMPVKLKVKEYRNEGQYIPQNIKAYFDSNPEIYTSVYDMAVLEVEEIKEDTSGSAEDITLSDITPGPNMSSTIKVADLLNLVKGDAEKYIPKPVAKLSTRDPNTARTAKVLERENARLKEDVQDLRDLVKLQSTLTHGQKFKPSTVEKMANLLMKDHDAKGEESCLTALHTA